MTSYKTQILQVRTAQPRDSNVQQTNSRISRPACSPPFPHPHHPNSRITELHVDANAHKVKVFEIKVKIKRKVKPNQTKPNIENKTDNRTHNNSTLIRSNLLIR